MMNKNNYPEFEIEEAPKFNKIDDEIIKLLLGEIQKGVKKDIAIQKASKKFKLKEHLSFEYLYRIAKTKFICNKEAVDYSKSFFGGVKK